jgi:hypothetical protein
MPGRTIGSERPGRASEGEGTVAGLERKNCMVEV